MVRYQIEISDPVAHLLKINCVIETSQSPQQFRLPSWIPGSYMIRDFAKHVIEFHAADQEGKELLARKVDKSTWEVDAKGGYIKLTYFVYAWDLSVRGAHCDQTHAFFNGTSVFLEVLGQAEQACLLGLKAPEFKEGKHWSVATSMSSAPEDISDNPAEIYGFGDYYCENYDELIDHPFEIADLECKTFYIEGVRHDFAVYGRHNTDLDRVIQDLTKICQAQVDVFGGLPEELDRYVFLVTLLPSGYGGLEHRASTALHASYKDLPNKGEVDISESYQKFLGLCSHEYFHTWNVKRIKPQTFIPFDLTREQHTELLWFFEGVTSYFDDLALVTSGVVKTQDYLTSLSKTITHVYRSGGRLKQSLAESSFDAWTKFYKQDENAPNAIVSYYTKGSLVALCLDATIREKSQNTKSLKDVMRYVWQHYAKKGKGLTEAEMPSIIYSATEVNVESFLRNTVYSSADLPLEEALSYFGIDLEWRAAKTYKDMGGKPIEKPVDVNLGVMLKQHASGAQLHFVYHDGNAFRAGLSAGDIIVAVNHRQVTSDTIEEMISQLSVGDFVEFHAFRREELNTFSTHLIEAEKNTAELKINEDKETSAEDWFNL